MAYCIIPARIGSKRIKEKNIKNFVGKPMIGYAIETAFLASSVDSVFVSTDDERVAEISRSFGAIVPFLRPKDLADDLTPTKPVIQDFIKNLISQGLVDQGNDYLCLYPCTPFLTSRQIDNGHQMLDDLDADFVFPIQRYSHPIQRAMQITNCKVDFVEPEHELSRTQDLPERYFDIGQFYWGREGAWLSNKNMHSSGHGLVIDKSMLMDIDTDEDWWRAEQIYKIMAN